MPERHCDACQYCFTFPENRQALAAREVRKAWDDHAKHDVYLTLSEVKELCEQFLPEAKILRHLRWRYTVIWQRSLSTEL